MGVQLGLMALGGGLSLLSAYLLKKKEKSPVLDDKPTTLVERGSYIPWSLGTRALGSVFCFAGGRSTTKEKVGSSGGKGLFSKKDPKTTIYHEEGLHVLCVGPAKKLHRITQNGKIIFDGPITSTSHPSGTTIDLGKEGSFKIFWGEQNQPINKVATYPGWGLDAASRIGIASRWPFFCYVQWNKKRLGASAQWSRLVYTVEKRTTQSVLTQSTAYMSPEQTEGGTVYDVSANNDGVAGVGYFKIDGDMIPIFKPGNEVKWIKDVGDPVDITVKLVETAEVVDYVVGDITYYKTVSTIYFDETLSGTTIDDQLNPYEISAGHGINPAHAIAELLFANYPNGLALDQDDWDIDALEELGVESAPNQDDIFTNWLGQNGEEADGILGTALQDLGVMLPIDPETGKISFARIREPVGTGDVKELPGELIIDPLPEIETSHGINPVDKLIFSFPDQAYDYKENTISLDEDGQASYLNHQRSRKVPIAIATNFVVASKIAERRSQEELGGSAVIDVYANRGARMLYPGIPIIVPNIDDILRITSVDVQSLSSRVKLTCSVDFYGAKKSAFENTEGEGQAEYNPVQPDLATTFVEIPELFLEGGTSMGAFIPHIRAHNQIVGSGIWVSNDDSSYIFEINEENIHTGGTLQEALPATTVSQIAQGPTFLALGDDIARVEDLSAQESLWRKGKQIAIINNEVFFLKKITAMGGGIYRLDGLLRARWDTQRGSHDAGHTVFIFQYDEAEWLQSLLLNPQADFFVKTTAYSGGGQISLDSAPKIAIEPTQGKGIVPMRCPNLRLTLPRLCVPAYMTGEALKLEWDYMTLSGAGQQGFGKASSPEPLDGAFILRITDGADIVKRQLTLTDTYYDYLNAYFTTDFGSEPASFKAKVSVTRGGWESEVTTLVITKEA